MSLCGYTHMSAGGLEDQERQLDSPELVFQVVVSGLKWVLEAELGSLEDQHVFLTTELSVQILEAI